MKPRKQDAFENNEETQKLKTEKHVTSSKAVKKKPAFPVANEIVVLVG
jgi:hypothetical protein